ncbi:MAG TPA: GNAT family N-acetyltransferase [Microscillaceae bacterium]|nr:GNAT family N-acetyltransferase [Microscillaceae bacterium]
METLLKDNIYLVEANVEDAETLADLQCAMAWETEEYKLDKTTVLKGLKALFEDTAKGKYYKLVCKEDIVGCMLNTFEWSEWRNGYILWIQSLYIVPSFRGKGLFKRTYQYLQNLVNASDDLQGIRLYVDKTNVKATKTYEAIGMNGEHYHFFEWMQ